jgi:hypothetical protein
MAASSADQLFIKVHDAYTRNADARPLFPSEATAGVIYAVRNPLDVAVSFAHHEDLPVDTIIDRMANDDYAMSAEAGRLYSHVPARLLTWSGHATSWVDDAVADADLNVLVVRYEDLSAKPVSTFRGVVRFLGLAEDDASIQRAVEFSRFDRLREQEVAHGFGERQATSPSFFRAGRVGSWRDGLTASQVDRLVANHRLVMRRFGYLTDTDEVPC